MKPFFGKTCLVLVLLVALATGGYSAQKRTLILYFTMPERDAPDAVAGSSRIVEKGKVIGNVEWLARVIQSRVGGDMVALATTKAYPAKHAPLVDQASAELKAGARPKLQALGVKIEDYDLIFLGYPIWWADLPMPLYTFLESQDLGGKTLVPFSSHGGSGLAGTVATLTRLLPGTRVIQDAFTVSRNAVSQSRQSVVSWIDSLPLADKR